MVRITKERRAKMEKKGGKIMEKKDLFRITSMFVMILLLPLLPTLIYVGYKLIIIPSLPSMQVQQVFRIIICGIPLSLIIAYGYITRDKITSILSGVFLSPLFTIYSSIFWALADHYFTIEWLIGWLRWQLIPPSVMSA
jgi:nitrous oxidase accessory protein